MNFWKMVFGLGFGADFIRKAVITKENPFGEITTDEFKAITNEDFVKVEKPVEVPAASTTTNPTAPPETLQPNTGV